MTSSGSKSRGMPPPSIPASLAMNREAVNDRLEARKELAIAKVAPKLVGVEDVAEAEEIVGELRDDMLDELDAIERELGLTGAIST